MKVIIAGGGTAGHINPGLAIAKHIKVKRPDAEILFIGTKKGLEKELVPREGFKIQFIKSRGFERKISFDVFFTIKDMILGYLEARKIIKSFKPDIVIGTGGYVCLPTVLAASRLKIFTMIHEANSFPGIANRILGKLVDVVAISFKNSEKYFKNVKRVIHTGNPVRDELISTSKVDVGELAGLDKDAPLVLVFGGSRGAQKINETILEIIKQNEGNFQYNFVFATGQQQYDIVKKKMEDSGLKLNELRNIKIVPYIFNMAEYMAAADLVVSRAGAITISEITAIGLPSILIPFPYATENHQEFNARTLEKQGASIVLLEKDLSAEILSQQITSLVNNKEQLARMAKNARKMGVLDACEKIVEVIEEYYNK